MLLLLLLGENMGKFFVFFIRLVVACLFARAVCNDNGDGTNWRANSETSFLDCSHMSLGDNISFVSSQDGCITLASFDTLLP